MELLTIGLMASVIALIKVCDKAREKEFKELEIKWDMEEEKARAIAA